MLLESIQQFPFLLIVVSGLLGLMVGSFLNVVIYRLPLMMQSNWRRECLEFLALPAEEAQSSVNLMWPGSYCPHCHTPIKAHHNIPVMSYCLLGGKCAHCSAPISMRYPLIEAFSCLCSAVVAWQFGYGWPLVFGLLMTWSLIAMSFIDIDQHLLPDSMTLPLTWLGLLLSLFGLYSDSHDSIVGAIAGYLSLWSVYWLFKLFTGKEGMGYGDFKLLAMFGAWFGWQALPLIIMLSSMVGAVVGIGMIIWGRHDVSKPIPFGPYLAAAGWLALLWGDRINGLYLNAVGL